jgi:excinuclease ABC subunit A
MIRDEVIGVRGAREHNLKNIDVEIPKNTLTIITGPSGSGKSSLALDILHKEGKRRYMESLSSYARQFLGVVGKPDVDSITGLCPSIAIEQKTIISNPRSTVGTITEIHDYLRVLYARIGQPHCPGCGAPIKAASLDSIVDVILCTCSGSVVTFLAPLVVQKKGEYSTELMRMFQAGLYRFIINGVFYKFRGPDEIQKLNLHKTHKHVIDLVVDSFEISVGERARVTEAVEHALRYGNGTLKVKEGDNILQYSSERMCIGCKKSITELEPRMFSFNSPLGACGDCEGLGVINAMRWYAMGNTEKNFFAPRICARCDGKRLNECALAVTVGGANIAYLGSLSIKKLVDFFHNIVLDELSMEITRILMKEIVNRLTFLVDVGLGYLTLNRASQTLSGGEGQRIRLATQIGSALSGVLYVLDEPSIGLHQRDNDRLIATLKSLRNLGNTVLVVEHDTDTMKQADYLIDMGPGAGILGGYVTAVGSPEEVMRNPHSLTGQYLSGKQAISMPDQLRVPHDHIVLQGLSKNNLKNITVSFPLGVLCGISGVSGSGKSTLIMHELVPTVKAWLLHKDAPSPQIQPKKGIDTIRDVVVIDQSPIGRLPHSNPATYLGIFNDIRKLYASLPESNARGYTMGRFSFNVKEGRCSECHGDGSVRIEMHFLAPVFVVCKVCHGTRYSKATLDISYKGKNIADVLKMTVLEAYEFFSVHKPIARRLQLLCDVGLEYVPLGQSAPTLSGGEAQRIKLVNELAKRGTNTLYILDEPTTGLHAHDIVRLLKVLNRLVDKGNSMIVIEHNLDVLKTVDWLIDLGPEGGDEGGYVVAAATPADVAGVTASHTGRYLQNLLEGNA